jgi:parvulin-like peptidyl-prolyl isomerase
LTVRDGIGHPVAEEKVMTRKLLSILGALVVACPLPAQLLDATVATVKLTKTQPITASALKTGIATAQKQLAALGRTITDADRTTVLNNMIDLALLKQAAERDHVQVSDAQVTAMVEQQRQNLSKQVGRVLTVDDLKTEVAAEGQTWDAWLANLRDSLLPQDYIAQVHPDDLKSVAPASVDDIRWFYESNPAQFVIARMIEIEHIFVDTQGKDAAGSQDALAKIKVLADRIAKGETFEDVAVASSEDKTTKDKGGYVGFLRLDQAQAKSLGKEFIVGILPLKEGQVSGVLHSAFGYHIVKVLRIIPAKLYALDEKVAPAFQETARDTIANGLDGVNRQQAITTAIQGVLRDLRKTAEIKINESSLGFTLVK